MWNYAGTAALTNCTFFGNEGAWGGGGIGNEDNSPVLTNCILWGDSPDELYNYNADPSVTYSCIQGGYPGTGNILDDPLFVGGSDVSPSIFRPDRKSRGEERETPCWTMLM